MGKKIENKIYVCYHKKSDYIYSDILFPIQVGSNISTQNLDMIKDNSGDNISSKNPYFCELTALYWIWKNVNADNVGIFHYRRFFNFKNNTTSINKIDENFITKYNITNEVITQTLKNNDIILPIPSGISLNIYNHYKRNHIISDLDKCIDIIKKKYPQMNNAINIAMNSHKFYICNMFISSKKFFDNYCTWLFDILFTLEKQIQKDVEKRDTFQKRVYGFLSERLLNIYIIYQKETNNIKIKEVPIIYIEKDKSKYIMFKLKMFKRKVLSFFGYKKEYW